MGKDDLAALAIGALIAAGIAAALAALFGGGPQHKCPHCGAFVRQNAAYCGNCYTKLRW